MCIVLGVVLVFGVCVYVGWLGRGVGMMGFIDELLVEVIG